MTVAELLAALKGVDPSRTVVVRQSGKGNGRIRAKTACERVMGVGVAGVYVPLESLTDASDDVAKHTVFAVEG